VLPQTVSVTLRKDLPIGAKKTGPRFRGLGPPQYMYPYLADVWVLLLHGCCSYAVSRTSNRGRAGLNHPSPHTVPNSCESCDGEP
jgi:hypothetical protein